MCVFIQFYESTTLPEVKSKANIPFSDVTFIRPHDDQLTALFEDIMSFRFSTLTAPGSLLPNCIFRLPF